ncbi:MAG: RDD family protein [Rickettsiaceae bacterium]|nr:RDD family protein [Rickettsiaceae bacterium]
MNAKIENNLKYAGLIRRYGAYLIDVFILYTINFVIGYIVGRLALISDNYLLLNIIRNETENFYIYAVISAIILATIYYTYFEGKWGASLGKKLFKLKIIDVSGKNISYMQAFLRLQIQLILLYTKVAIMIFIMNIQIDPEYLTLINTSLTLINALITLINIFLFLFHDQKRIIHDLIIGTVVIHKK